MANAVPANQPEPNIAFELEIHPSTAPTAGKGSAQAKKSSAVARKLPMRRRSVYRLTKDSFVVWQQLMTNAKATKAVIEDVIGAARGAKSMVITNASPGASELLVRVMSMMESMLLPRLLEMPKQAFEESVTALLRNIAPPMSAPEMRMAQKVAVVRAAIIEEFGCYTREQLAAGSKAKNPGGLVDTWRSRGKLFAVSLPQSTAKDAEVYPAFQIQDGKPLPVVGAVIAIFGRSMSGWDLAHWFTGGNAMLPGSARPVDLLVTNPQAVEAAARFDAMPAAA